MRIPSFRCGVLLVLIGLLGPGLSAEVVNVKCGNAVVQVEAIAGEPFGVCQVTCLEPSIEARKAFWNHFGAASLEELRRSSVTEASSRALYPVRMDGRIQPADAKSEWKDASAAIFFLFRGKEPLALTFSGLGPNRIGGTVQVKPAGDVARLQVLQGAWWELRKAQSEFRKGLDNYDRSAEYYLDAMLARRMGLKDAEHSGYRNRHSADEVLGLLMGLESIRLAMQKEAFQGKNEGAEAANLPLPKAVAPPEQPVPAFSEAKVQVEPMALRVPASCFYLRSGSFEAFIQLLDLLDEHGTAARSLLSERGTDQALKARIEHQLALRTSTLSRLFGGTAVKEMAFLGRDTFFYEGSAVGVLMQARNQDLLRGHIEGLRKEALAQDVSIRETRISLGGRDVSLLESLGNGVRSFYVQDGEFHLVTNSRWIAEAFLATQAHPESALGSVKAFRYARSKVPPSADGAFFYLSDAFFRDLVGPANRVEMARRARVDAELTLMEMARAAAKAEGRPADDLAALIAEGFLPKDLGVHPDGSKLILEKGKSLDSLRGARGSLLPIPDLNIDQITQAEQEAYESFSSAYQRLWTNMDPVYGTLLWKTQAGAEKVALELHISPYVKSRYGMLLRFLGLPSGKKVAPIAGDLLSVEIHPKLDLPGRDEDDDEAGKPAKPAATPSFFGGLRDIDLPWRLVASEVQRDRGFLEPVKEKLRGYLGQTPAADQTAQRLLGISPRGKADAQGFIPLEDGLRGGRNLPAEAQTWGRRLGDFFIVGTGRELVKTVSGRLKLVADPFPAQVRLRVGDLKDTKLAGRIRAELYARDRRASASGAMLLQSLQEQFGSSNPVATAKELLGFAPLCPLGGTYQRDASGRWISTAWKEESLLQVNAVPDTYRSPIQAWIKGLSLDLAIDETTLNTRLVIDGRK